MIVGTAGHVDHGKSALVTALTGADPDRLPEEKTRGISIDLGFAYLPLGNAEVIGFVDVPGHERFMKNMLAGAGGVDFVLLTVALDDGIMPQTREHLAVLHLLGVTRGMVALTKCDLADEARIVEVEAQIVGLLEGTCLSGARIIRTSTVDGTGIGELRAALEDAARETAPPDAKGPLRFAVDRTFTLLGSGTVATGVVLSGEIKVGDRLIISPSGTEARVRALHVQNRPADTGHKGQRCGVNLGGVDLSEVSRGDFLLDPALHAPTERFNAFVHLLDSEQRSLSQWQPVRLHHGAGEFPARIALLDDQPIGPGGSGRIQIVLEQNIAGAIGDRFILRDNEGRRTIGGGRIVNLRAPRRRRRQPRQLARFDAMDIEDPTASLAAQLSIWPWSVELEEFARDRALGGEQLSAILGSVPHIAAKADGKTHLLAPDSWERLTRCALEEVGRFHERFPHFLGPNLQRLQNALDPPVSHDVAAAAIGLMVGRGLLQQEAGMLRLPGHKLGPDRQEEALWQKIEPLLSGENRFRPPRTSEIAEQLQAREFECRNVLRLMARQGHAVEIAPEHYFLRETLQEIAAVLEELASESEDGTFGVIHVRDRLENGRKVTIQLLEWFDRRRLTLRRGDVRLIDPPRISQFREEVREAA